MKFHACSAVIAVTAGFVFTHVADARKPISQPVSASDAVPIVAYTFGEIKKIDSERGTVTLKHGPIENLGMPDMTMIFRVAKPVDITSFKVGEQVRFKADRVQGALVVTEISALK